jgi:hypothetical protein
MAVLYGARADVHDFHAGAGDFARVVEALRGATVQTPVTRSNLHVLTDLPALLASQGAVRWTIELAPGPDRTVPPLGLAVPYALLSVDRARRAGVEAFVRGAPLCLVGPHADRCEPTAPRAFGAPCEACSARARCPGVDPGYLARFGDAELRALG